MVHQPVGVSNDHKHLDFVVVGAQKAGTTALFHALRTHPQLALPAMKEVPFFNSDSQVELGWARYADLNFGAASTSQFWGTVTPQYMCFPETSASRLFNHNPDLRIIAILRNPIDRAYSHYRMSRRRGFEHRSFEDAVSLLLEPGAIASSRLEPTETNAYLTWGEYARQLKQYLSLFPAGQVRLYFSEEFDRRPDQVLLSIYEFLGVETSLPSTDQLQGRYNAGGLRRRFPTGDRFKRNSAVRWAWRKSPRDMQQRIRTALYWYELWNVVAEPAPALAASLRGRLAIHFGDDVDEVARTASRRPPWRDW